VRNPDTRDDLAGGFLRRESYGEAYYVPSQGFISMPAFEAWTAHKSRLDRDLKNRFGSRKYGAEDLIAELGAAFLCAEFGFDGDLRHASCIAHWIELLKADKRAFFTACSQASKAADYVRGLALAEPTEVATGASIEVFFADRLATFGRGGAGWFWWSRRRGCSPDGSPTGPFATSYAAYRHAMISFGAPRSDNYGLRDDKLGAPDAENHGRGINAVSTPENKLPFWGVIYEIFLMKSVGSGGGTRTPDPRIMIPVL
jgi:hypothetical protein